MGSTTNDVTITVSDGALSNVSVPPGKTQAVVGCSSGGAVAAGTPYVTSSKTTVIANSGYGPITEAACMKIDAGGTVIVCQTPTVTAGAAGSVTHTGTGASVLTISGAPYDDFRMVAKVVIGGTIATNDGKQIQLSGDAGRTFGPAIALGAATTFVVPQTGMTLNFTTATVVAGDTYAWTTTAPLWNQAGVSAAISAINAQPNRWGAGIHVVGISVGTDASSIEGYLDTLATQNVFTFSFLDSRDFLPGDSTEAGWISALLTSYAGVSALRTCAGAGWYNMPSSVVNQTLGGLPKYRRSLTWAATCRRLSNGQPQILLSRVSDGPLAKIVVNPTTDPTDGYIYHDERVNPSLGISNGANGRFMAGMTRIGQPIGYFVDEPAIMCPAGSDFVVLPLREVTDIACGLFHQVLSNFINAGVRTKPDGTIFESDARQIERVGQSTIDANMTSVGMISSATFVLSRTDNIQTTKRITETARITALGYVFEQDLSVGFQSPAAVLGG